MTLPCSFSIENNPSWLKAETTFNGVVAFLHESTIVWNECLSIKCFDRSLHLKVGCSRVFRRCQLWIIFLAFFFLFSVTWFWTIIIYQWLGRFGKQLSKSCIFSLLLLYLLFRCCNWTLRTRLNNIIKLIKCLFLLSSLRVPTSHDRMTTLSCYSDVSVVFHVVFLALPPQKIGISKRSLQ
jgi:hypothetical protein